MISATDYGDKTIKAVYKNATYKIFWDLDDDDGSHLFRRGEWNGTVGASTYTYGTGLSKLPE